MESTDQYTNERLDHLGIVAGVCQEIGLAAWLDAQDPGNRQQVSVGTATQRLCVKVISSRSRSDLTRNSFSLVQCSFQATSKPLYTQPLRRTRRRREARRCV